MPIWNKVKLVDVCEKIGSGATPRGGDASYISHGISLVRSQNVLDYIFSKDGLAHITEQQAKELSNVELKERDVLVNITGDSVARVCQIPNEILPARVNQHVAILRADTRKLNPKYLMYCLLHPTNKESLLTFASTGATRKALTKGMLDGFEIQITDLSTQDRITNILSAFDDKIELNRQMNYTLEQMGQVVFKKYFVGDIDSDSLPVGWTKGKLGEYCNIFRGASPRPITDPKYFSNGTVPWIKIADATAENSIYINSTKEYCTELAVSKSRYLEKGSLVLSNSATVGIPKILNLNGCIHDGWLSFNSFKNITRNYLFFVLINNLQNFNQIATGSVQNNLNTGMLKDLDILIPDKKTLSHFDKLIQTYFDKILNNEIENKTLSNIRDTLLHKLMSGEVNLELITAIA